jgi:hypothetical protein
MYWRQLNRMHCVCICEAGAEVHSPDLGPERTPRARQANWHQVLVPEPPHPCTFVKAARSNAEHLNA